MKIIIMGIRGVPAQHGGFETFAEHLAIYLNKHGWEVIVYCQSDGEPAPVRVDQWRGIKRVIIPVSKGGALGTVYFDWRATTHLIKSGNDDGIILTLGYNTAVFCLLYRIKNFRNLINMDGIEWRRDKWRLHERVWLWMNERFGCWFGNHLIADHPEIVNHLATRVPHDKITMIPYGARQVNNANVSHLLNFGLSPGGFVVVIARPEPENSILDIVRAFSVKSRGFKLVMLGKYQPGINSFHHEVMAAASDEVKFLGAIYDKEIVESLRFYCRFYIHGHRVGGTNPSLVEALGAGSAVLAHDNKFNRWVVGDGAGYFHDMSSCVELMDQMLVDDAWIEKMQLKNRARFQQVFTWDIILRQYKELLSEWQFKSQH